MSEKIPQNYIFNESLHNEYKERLTNLVISLDDDRIDEYMADILKKDQDLKEKYGEEYKRYGSWHALVGSTIHNFSEIIADDFPGDDSVFKYIEILERKYDQE